MDSGHNVRAYERAGMGYDAQRADRLERENKELKKRIEELEEQLRNQTITNEERE